MFNDEKINRFIKFALFTMIISGVTTALIQILCVTAGLPHTTVYRCENFCEPKNYINIEATNLPVEIFAWTGDKIKITSVSETSVDITEQSSAVSIKQNESFSLSLFSLDTWSCNIKVYLPPREYREINVNTAGGDVYVHHIETRGLRVRTRSGNIIADEANADISLETVSGSINAVYDGFLNPTNITTVSGNVNLSLYDSLSVSMDFITNRGHFSGNFFRKDELLSDKSKTPLYAVHGSHPNKLTVKTASGNLQIVNRN